MTMATATLTPTLADPFADRKRWTADDCRQFETMGMLEAGTYELLDGEVILKLGQNMPHRIANRRTLFALTLVFGEGYVLMPGTLPVDDENSPEPDVSVTRLHEQDYIGRGNPTPSDMRLIVEIADTTLWRDLNTKMRLYAGAGVPEYWVLDINKRRLLVHRQPSARGYADIQEIGESGGVTPLAMPGSVIPVADLLP